MAKRKSLQSMDVESSIVYINADPAELNGVATKVLNQAARRNEDRYPSDFRRSQLAEEEKAFVVTNCDHLEELNFSPSMPRPFADRVATNLQELRYGD